MMRGFVFIFTLTGIAMGQAMVQHATAGAGGAAAAVGGKKMADSLESVLGGVSSSAAAAAGTTTKPQVVPAPPAPATGRRTKHSPFEPQASSAAVPAVPGPGYGGSIPSPSEVEAGSTSSGEAVPNNPWAPRGKGHPQVPVSAFSAYGVNEASTPTASRGVRRIAVGTPQLADSMVMPPVAPPAVMLQAVAVPPPPPPPTLATREKLAEIQPGASYEQIVATLGTPASKIEMMEDGKVLENLRIESRGTKIGTIRMTNGVVTAVEPIAR